jgi:ectoine hydroxylase-related dioxygenase (phytanoyl-CoA dioxygenase family)
LAGQSHQNEAGIGPASGDRQGLDESMTSELSDEQWQSFKQNGFLYMKAFFDDAEMGRIRAAMERLADRFPYGFNYDETFHSSNPMPRQAPPPIENTADCMFINNAAFHEPDLFEIYEKDIIYNTIVRALGPDFVVNSVVMQTVRPGQGRLSYHKDCHGTLDITLSIDEIGYNNGGSAIIPGSHLGTPPTSHCISRLNEPHPREVHAESSPGDMYFFTEDTWHARSANLGDRPVRRIMSNFQARASRPRAEYTKAFTQEQIEAATSGCSPRLRRMFAYDAGRTAEIEKEQAAWSPLKRWYMHRGNAGHFVLREFFYYWTTYTRRDPSADPQPHTTRLSEDARFSPLRYLAHLNPYSMVRNFAVAMLRKSRAGSMVIEALKRVRSMVT